jgi:hypothetical protein
MDNMSTVTYVAVTTADEVSSFFFYDFIWLLFIVFVSARENKA